MSIQLGFVSAILPDRSQQAVIAAAAQLGVGRMNTFVGWDWTKSTELHILDK